MLRKMLPVYEDAVNSFIIELFRKIDKLKEFKKLHANTRGLAFEKEFNKTKRRIVKELKEGLVQ